MNHDSTILPPHIQTPPPTDTDEQKPSALCTWLGTAMPIIFLLLGGIAFIISLSGPRPIRFVEIWKDISLLSKLLIPVSSVIGITGCTVILALVGFGKRIPAFLLLGLASLPWIYGNFCSFLAYQKMKYVLASEISAGILPIASDLAESLFTRLTGSMISASLLSGCAVGLAIAAIGQRATGRRFLFVYLLLASSLPLFIFTVFLTRGNNLGFSGFLPLSIRKF